ncbi:hypothetical protein [Nonomuraea angiospora]|uniref:hypothetical protein n=1 Tax=Nonomuraea angiospora TaxID=46172 RepID=UPI0029A7AAB1|nr:hypothetical protein [Nonomuraea angiospora]MDX3099699.1 hypothetical protein [Nonomuraea angiospora]
MTISTLLAALNGSTIPGGCDTCNAEQEVARVGRITHITVHHDNQCPTLKQKQNRR